MSDIKWPSNLCFCNKSIPETQAEEVNIIIDNEVNVDEDGCADHMNIDHEELNEEGQHSQETGNEGDQDWTPEEAETAYEQAGDDDCGQGSDPKYVYFFLLFVLLSLSLS